MASSIPPKSSSRLPGAASQSAAERDIGALLRVAFAEAEAAKLPQAFIDLLDRLGQDEAVVTPAPEGLSDTEFKNQLSAVIAPLRIYARSISGSVDLADDLVQEALLKAWSARGRYRAGTNMRAWTYVILRNHYFSQVRRARFKGEWDEFTADLLLAQPANQEAHIALSDVQRGLLQLPDLQREALILVGAGGMAYEEVAEICGCAVGTIKSRVARGRAALAAMMETGNLPSRQSGSTAANAAPMVDQIMNQVETLRHG
ncbi:MAG TPA: sigma-70 family RNA polymerase sigma factor [Polymorphobacter sp.]|jgi:RNA polymerase sigma-70 factor (ECF subfamily)|nr:sigma-70 family RNA polymerase sigma factor [Polymorphobacter sp.]